MPKVVVSDVQSSERVIAVPGADVALLELDLPGGVSGVSREDVARRQLRDVMAIDPETVEMRPFPGAQQAGQWDRLLVVDKNLAARWRSEFSDGGAVILPDYMTLPTAPDVWTVARTAHGVAVRLGPQDGFGADAEVAKVMLERALTTGTPPRACLCLGLTLPGLEALMSAHAVPIETDPEAVGARRMAHGEASVDLGKVPQLARARMAARVLPWRWPVILGVVAGLMWAASQVVVTNRIVEDTRDLQDQTIDLVQKHFVGNAPVLDARVQVSQALAEMRVEAAGPQERSDPLGLFAEAAQALAAAGATTDLASYNASEGLQVIARLEDFAAIERLQQLFEQRQLKVEVQETEAMSGGSGVRAVLRLNAGEEHPSGDGQ